MLKRLGTIAPCMIVSTSILPPLHIFMYSLFLMGGINNTAHPRFNGLAWGSNINA